MKISDSTRYKLTVIALFFMPIAAKAQSLQISNNLQIEVVDVIETKELWSSSNPKAVESKNVIVDFRQFDSESRPKKGKWRGCGLVMIGNSDVGTKPLSFKVWTVGQCDLSVVAKDGKNYGSTARFVLAVSAKEFVNITVSGDLQVTVSNKLIGSIVD